MYFIVLFSSDSSSDEASAKFYILLQGDDLTVKLFVILMM